MLAQEACNNRYLSVARPLLLNAFVTRPNRNSASSLYYLWGKGTLRSALVLLACILWSCASASNSEFAILSSTPEDGAVQVAVNTSVELVFNEEIDRSTLSDATFQLEDQLGNRVEGTVSTNEYGGTFSPLRMLAANADYIVRFQAKSKFFVCTHSQSG